MSVNAGRFTAIGGLPGGTSVVVYNHGTATVASLYTDGSDGTAAPNPVTASAEGDLTFFAAPGTYDLVFARGDLSATLTVAVSPNPTLAWPG